MKIFKEFRFEAAHKLPNVPSEHKCARLHGHSFKVRITVTGEVDEKSGWVMDFADIKTSVRPILKQLDHYYLNEIRGLENPTSENIAIWIWNNLLIRIIRYTSTESHNSSVVFIYHGRESSRNFL